MRADLSSAPVIAKWDSPKPNSGLQSHITLFAACSTACMSTAKLPTPVIFGYLRCSWSSHGVPFFVGTVHPGFTRSTLSRPGANLTSNPNASSHAMPDEAGRHIFPAAKRSSHRKKSLRWAECAIRCRCGLCRICCACFDAHMHCLRLTRWPMPGWFPKMRCGHTLKHSRAIGALCRHGSSPS